MSNGNKQIAIMQSGSVEYSMESATVSLEDLREMVDDMEQQGVTHVVVASGNYRGAKWQHLPLGWEFQEDYFQED